MADKDTKKVEEEGKESGKDFKEKAGEAMDKASEVAGKTAEKAGELFDQFSEGAKKAGAKAGVVLEDVAAGTKKAAKKAGETAGDMMDNIIIGVRKASEKASDSIKVMEVKHEISKLESASKKILPKITDKVLELYKANKIKEPELIALCDEIESIKMMIEAKLEKIEEIKTTESNN